jgi:diaminopimelate decarboxylase
VGKGVLTPAEVGPTTTASAGVHRRDGVLYCDELAVDAICAELGTPAYIYSARSIRLQYTRLSLALGDMPHRLHYSVKANSSLGVLALLRTMGAGVDIVSGGELYRALEAGFTGADVVFSGVGKTETEIREALDAGVKLINVESEGELEMIDRIAGEMRVIAPVALRINPEVTVDSPHPYIRTGEKGMKFGVPYDQAVPLGVRANEMENVSLIGLDMHIGSQIATLGPYKAGIEKVLEVLAQLRKAGADELEYLDIGGGLAVTYDAEESADIAGFAAGVVAAVKPTGLELILEPGRFIVGNAGILVTSVIDRKHSGGKEYIVTDAGMNDLLRPSHYQAFHRIEATVLRDEQITADVVGPVCESGDFFALDRLVDNVNRGDRLAIFSAGAYGFVMASNYNSRPRPPEILVDGDRYAVVRERERYADLVRHETPSGTWRTL